MAAYSEENILDSKADFLCFAASTILRPKDIHGDNFLEAPMSAMSALASALCEYDNRLPTVIAGQYQKTKLMFQQTLITPFTFVRLDDGRLISPFIVRRHTAEVIDNKLTMQSADALFRRILAEIYQGRLSTYALERPVDADAVYDKIVAMLPDNVTIYNELRA